jgi:ABC-type transporter MlaC component
MQTQRLGWQVYDVWIRGAMLLTGMQQNGIPVQIATELEKEGR